MKEQLIYYIKRLDTVTSFIILELLAFTSFALGGINAIFYYLSIVVLIFALPFFIVAKKEELKQLLFYSIPLFLLAALVSFGKLYSSSGFLLENIGIFLAFISFYLLGFLARHNHAFKKDYLLLSIGGAFALLAIISLVYTWINYGIFYGLIYQDTPEYYWNGLVYNVTDEIRWLNGLGFETFDVRYSGTYAYLLLGALPSLLFISPKKDKLKFALTSFIAFVGLLLLITTPNLEGLFYLIPLFIFILLYRFYRVLKVNKWLDITLLVIGAIASILFIIDVIHVFHPLDIITNNSFLNRLFNTNKIISPINEVISYAFTSGGLFGLNEASQAVINDTNAFEFEILKEGGVFAFVSLLVFLIFTYLMLKKYFLKSKDPEYFKIIVLTSVFMFFLYNTFSFTSFPYVHTPNVYYSFYRSLPLFVILFILGYVFTPIFTRKEIIMSYEDEEYMKQFLAEKKQASTTKKGTYDFDEVPLEEDKKDE